MTGYLQNVDYQTMNLQPKGNKKVCSGCLHMFMYAYINEQHDKCQLI